MNRVHKFLTSQGGGLLRYEGTILKVTDPRASLCEKVNKNNDILNIEKNLYKYLSWSHRNHLKQPGH